MNIKEKILKLKNENINEMKNKNNDTKINNTLKTKKDNDNIKIDDKNNNNNNNNENNIKTTTLEKEQLRNEKAKIRCIGMTIETRPDYADGNEMLRLGATRVELGIQSVYEDVLKKIERGHTVKQSVDTIRNLKDLGFKLNFHYMPGLTSYERDLKGMKTLFSNPEFRPDMIKVYPCMVLKGTKLYKLWKQKKYTPLTTEQATKLIAEFKREVPEYCRIMRVQRDIVSNVISAGVDRTNLRQYISYILKKKKIKCNCIRCREIGKCEEKIDYKKIKIKTTHYNASRSDEFFIAAEYKDYLVGFCRLRFPSKILRKEITKDSALIRELHVYGSLVRIGKKGGIQHRGSGKKLLEKAEEIAKIYNKNKIIVISGIGVREYFAKFGYKRDGPYMSKIIKKENMQNC
jgi:elongator complex protein 3